jgi:hypothetical protein
VLAALGRQGVPEDRVLTGDALFFLLHSNDRYGTWMNGQATVRVLQALLPLAAGQLKAPPRAGAIDLTINGVPLSGMDSEALRADAHLLTAPRSLDLTSLLRPGRNELVFTGVDDSTLASVEAVAEFYVPWPPATPAAATQTGNNAGLDFAYRCAAEASQAGRPVECSVTARRFGSAGYGMLLAEVGLPPGAEVDRAALGKLLEDWTISRYELQPDRIVFYLWSSPAAGVQFKFQFTPRYPIHAKAAPATLSDYYNPDLQVVLAPQLFTVGRP